MDTTKLDEIQQELLQHISDDLGITDMHSLIHHFKSTCSEMNDFDQIYLNVYSRYTGREISFIFYLLGTQMMICDISDNFIVIPKLPKPETQTDNILFIQDTARRAACDFFECPSECTNYMCNYPDCAHTTIKPAPKNENDI